MFILVTNFDESRRTAWLLILLLLGPPVNEKVPLGFFYTTHHLNPHVSFCISAIKKCNYFCATKYMNRLVSFCNRWSCFIKLNPPFTCLNFLIHLTCNWDIYTFSYFWTYKTPLGDGVAQSV
jgi:hypothetical protein